LARPLLVVPALATLNRGQTEVTYLGTRFHVDLDAYKGDQLSPFRDGTRTCMDVKVTNVRSGKPITYSLLVPQMIERYGFYEGKALKYRIEPLQILEVFDFLKPAARR